jgi:hypothetical protein
VKKLLYVSEVDAERGSEEYAIRQSAALARAGLEVHFWCKASFPKERLGESLE